MKLKEDILKEIKEMRKVAEKHRLALSRTSRHLVRSAEKVGKRAEGRCRSTSCSQSRCGRPRSVGHTHSHTSTHTHPTLPQAPSSGLPRMYPLCCSRRRSRSPERRSAASLSSSTPPRRSLPAAGLFHTHSHAPFNSQSDSQATPHSARPANSESDPRACDGSCGPAYSQKDNGRPAAERPSQLQPSRRSLSLRPRVSFDLPKGSSKSPSKSPCSKSPRSKSPCSKSPCVPPPHTHTQTHSQTHKQPETRRREGGLSTRPATFREASARPVLKTEAKIDADCSPLPVKNQGARSPCLLCRVVRPNAGR